MVHNISGDTNKELLGNIGYFDNNEYFDNNDNKVDLETAESSRASFHGDHGQQADRRYQVKDSGGRLGY